MIPLPVSTKTTKSAPAIPDRRLASAASVSCPRISSAVGKYERGTTLAAVTQNTVSTRCESSRGRRAQGDKQNVALCASGVTEDAERAHPHLGDGRPVLTREGAQAFEQVRACGADALVLRAVNSALRLVRPPCGALAGLALEFAT